MFDTINSASPDGYSPTAEALRRGYDYYTKGDGHCLPGSQWVLLVNNGGANCNSNLNCGECLPIPGPGCYNDGTVCYDGAAVVSVINDLASANVKTFVVGMPGNDADTASLDAYANAGKMPNVNGLNGNAYYSIPDASGAPDLLDVFTTTTGTLNICRSELPTTPVNPDATHVFMNCMPVEAASSDSGSGWYFDHEDSSTYLAFRGDICNVIESESPHLHAIDIFTDCPSQ